MKRILILVSCVSLLVCAFALPASAANIDYNDLISNIVADGDNDLVTITVPEQYFMTQIVDGVTGEALVTNDGGTASYFLSAAYPYTFIFYAFQNGSDRLLLDNIPDNTVCVFDFSIVSTGDSHETPSLFSDWYYFDSGGQYLGMNRAEHGNSTPAYSNFSVTHTISKLPGTTAGSVNFTFYHLKPLQSCQFMIRLKSLSLTFTISSLYRLQEQTGKTNAILNEVEKQLADQGKTLDEVLGAQQDTNEKLDSIINNKPLPTIPNQAVDFNQLYDKEEALKGEVSSGIDEAQRIQTSAIAVLLQYAGAFAVVAWVFNLFADVGFFSGLLYVSMALGVFAVLLGVVPTIMRRYSNSPGKE